MVESIIAVGSNVGDKEGNLRRAIEMVSLKMSLTRISSIYETEPMYNEEQDWFLNCVIAVETNLKPLALLQALQAIEVELGRQRTVRYGPRVIDLDILFYGDEIVFQSDLEIPHPKIAERPFVLVPLCEIRPELVHPVLKKKASELLDSLKSGKRVVRRSDLLSDLVSSYLLPR